MNFNCPHCLKKISITIEATKRRPPKVDEKVARDVQGVIRFYHTIFGDEKVTPAASRKVRTRLINNSVDVLCNAILGCAHSPFHVTGGFIGLDHIMHSDERVLMLARKTRRPGTTLTSTSQTTAQTLRDMGIGGGLRTP